MFRAGPKTAAEWFVRLSAGPISTRDKYALARWVAGGPDRLRELENSSLLWKISGGLDGSTIARSYLEQDSGFETPSSGWLQRKAFSRILIPSAAMVALAVIALIAVPQIEKLLFGPRLSNGDAARTALNQITTYTLPGRFHLNPGGRFFCASFIHETGTRRFFG